MLWISLDSLLFSQYFLFSVYFRFCLLLLVFLLFILCFLFFVCLRSFLLCFSLSVSLRLLTCSPSRPSVQGGGATGDEASWCLCVGWPMLLSVSVSFTFSVFPWFFCVLPWVTLPVFIFSGLCFRPPLSRSLSLPCLPLFVRLLSASGFFFLEIKEQR